MLFTAWVGALKCRSFVSSSSSLFSGSFLFFSCWGCGGGGGGGVGGEFEVQV